MAREKQYSSWKERAEEIEAQDRIRRRREIALIVIFVFILAGAFFVELYLSKISHTRAEFPLLSSTLFFAFWNLIFILSLVLIFLVVRNLVKLIFERRKRIFGAHLRTRLVIAFIALTIGPTLVLFNMSRFFIKTSIERWFDPAVSGIYETSKQIIKATYEMKGEENLHFARQLSRKITQKRLLSSENFDQLKALVEAKQEEYALDAIEVFSGQGEEIFRAQSPELKEIPLPKKDVIKKALRGYEGYFREPAQKGDIIRGVMPIFSSWEKKRDVVGAVVISQLLSTSLSDQLEDNRKAFDEYQQLKSRESSIRRQHLTILILITLTVFFLSIWFGFYIARGITIPIQLLAEGTQEVASGNLDYRIEREAEDEIGTLVKSFNKMTEDLKRSRKELEQRRIYIETVLANIDSGVIATDPSGRIITVNQPALWILEKKKEELVGKALESALPQSLAEHIKEMEAEQGGSSQKTITRQLSLPTRERELYLKISLSRMIDADGQLLGKVLLLEDLTDLVRAQRSLAWREVARRIAHEIKNPLTPIQLSAQRLLRRFEDKLGEEAGVLRECTSMIIRQVEEMKRLVDEFSSYARLPSLNLTSAKLNPIVEEVVNLYKESHPEIDFVLELDPNLPEFKFDRDQIKRAIINLVDNAIESLEGQVGTISIKTSYIAEKSSCRIEIADTGRGISARDRERVFEPYYSTKPHGTGLGLAIVQRIINDHYGTIWVEENKPKGSRFIIELPIETRLVKKVIKEGRA